MLKEKKEKNHHPNNIKHRPLLFANPVEMCKLKYFDENTDGVKALFSVCPIKQNKKQNKKTDQSFLALVLPL